MTHLFIYTPIFAFSALLLAGCSQPLQPDPEETTDIQPEQAIHQATPSNLDSPTLFHFLAGEISTQRNSLDEAFGHYMISTRLASDAYSAERATRIALQLDDLQKGLEAAEAWRRLAPKSSMVRQVSAILFLRNKQPAQALEQCRELIALGESREGQGFLQIASILTKEAAPEDARQIIETLAAEHPDNTHALYAMSLVAAQQERLEEAQQLLRRTISLSPEWETPYLLLARVLVQLQQQQLAREILQKAVNDHQDRVQIQLTYGRLLIDADEIEAALAQFRRTAKQHPDNPEVLVILGALEMQTQHWQAARKVWQRLRDKGQRVDQATYFLAQIEEDAGNTEAAIELYGKVSHHGLRIDAYTRLARLQAQAGDITSSRDTLAHLRVLNPNQATEVYISETHILREFGTTEQVLDAFREAITAFPENLDLRYNRGLYAAESDLLTLMENDFLFIIRQKPDHADALNALGYTLADKTDRHQEALDYILEANRLKPDNAAILDSLGWAYYRLGDLNLSLEHLRRAASKSDDDEIASHLGEVLWVSGDRQQARNVWDTALKQHPNSTKLKRVIQRFLK